MSVTELHPEELLDQTSAGSLPPTEDTKDIEGHVRRCPACAAHRHWRRDVDATLENAIQTADRSATDALVRTALARRSAGTVEAPGAAIAMAVVPARRGRRNIAVFAAAVAVCVASGAAGATLWPVVRRLWLEPAAATSTTSSASRAKAIKRHAPLAPTLSAAPPSTASSPPASASSTPPSPVRDDGDPSRDRGRGGRRRTQLATADDLASQERPLASTDTATAVFTELVAARRSNQLTAARTAHERLARSFPGTREERSGRVLLAEIALRHGDLGTAEELFSRYLASDPGGTLAEEARLGRARALAGLGRPADEERAWRDLVDHHPRSVHSAGARIRLEAPRSVAR